MIRSHLNELIAVSVVAGLALPTAWTGEGKESPAYPTHVLTEAPVLDGRIEGDAAWKGIPRGVGFEVIGGRRQAPKETFFRAGFTSETLYVGVMCMEPEVGKLRAAAAPGEEVIWKDDGVELFVLAPGAKSVFQVIANPARAHTPSF